MAPLSPRRFLSPALALMALVLFCASSAAAQDSPTGGITPLALPGLYVTPDGGTTPTRAPYTSGHTATFTVNNNTGNAINVGASCSGSANVTCTGTSPSSFSMAKGAKQFVTVTYSVQQVGTGTLSLEAEGGGVDVGSFNVPVAVPPPPTYAVAVTPDGQHTADRLPNTGGYTQVFTVKNNGNTSNTFALSCSGASGVTCSSLGTASVTLAAGASAPVTATYATQSQAGNGSLTVTASSSAGSGASDTGTVLVPVVFYAVAVTPDGGTTPQRRPHSGPYTASFTVQNQGSWDEYTIGCGGTGGVTCTGTSITTLTVPANQSATVTATYTVSNPAQGTLTLSALGLGLTPGGDRTGDSGTYTVPIDYTRGPPTAALRHHNGDHQDRARCLTASAGLGAAYQCGDLLLAHGMPGFTTLGRERALTLLYSSATARPRPAVAVAVTQPADGAAPDTVRATLRVAGAPERTASYGGWNSGALSRQLVLDLDAAGLATGIYPFTLEVTNVFLGAGAYATSVAGELLVVNRANTADGAAGRSRFGAGWHLAGLETLYPQADGRLLWVGGDGSAKVYGALGGGLYEAPLGAYRDTIRYGPTATGDYEYVRTLRHGVTVAFDPAGRHRRTTGRTGHSTVFGWDLPANRLESITVPPAGASGTTYTLAYEASGHLDRLTDPAGRVLDVTVNARRLTALTDPDAMATYFTYRPDGLLDGHLPRGASTTTGWTSYAYTGNRRLTGVTVPVGRDASDAATATTGFAPWDEWGRPGTPARDVAEAHTQVLGPRPAVADDATFWVDRWGAPTTIRDALGAETRIVRGDPAHPALVTQVTYPWQTATGSYIPGRIVMMTYNDRGNLESVHDSTKHLEDSGLPTGVTHYFYADSTNPDSPTQVHDSIPGSARKSVYTYNSRGLTRTATDSRLHTTRFEYDSLGSGGEPAWMVKQVVEEDVETWEGGTNDRAMPLRDHVTGFAYDGKGNLRKVTSPTGVATSYERDAAGRITNSYDPLGMRQEWRYDAMNRDTLTIRYTAPAPHPEGLAGCDPAQVVCGLVAASLTPDLGGSLETRRYYSVGLDSVSDPRGAKRRYFYDARGLLAKERDEVLRDREVFFDESGALLKTLSRPKGYYRIDACISDSTILRDSVVSSYDVMGRLEKEIVSRAVKSICNGMPDNPVPGDTVDYTYDVLGNVTRLENRNGAITRTYYANGLLRTQKDSLSETMLDSVAYSYDATGALTKTRRTWVSSAASETDEVAYAYTPSTGDLASITVKWSARTSSTTRTINFAWDGLGRRRGITFGPSLNVQYRYDKAGILRRLDSENGWVTQNDRFDFTYRADSIDAVGRIGHQVWECGPWTISTDNGAGRACGTKDERIVRSTYNRLGWLAEQWNDDKREAYEYDKSGNMTARYDPTTAGRRDSTEHTFVIDSLTNRMYQDRGPFATADDWVRVDYDGNGNRIREWKEEDIGPNLTTTLRYYHYDGRGRTAGIQDPFHSPDARIDCLQYDAAGNLQTPCDDYSVPLVYQGPNVVATHGYRWVFVHGPGVDDPLIGLWREPGSPSGWRDYIWITDGAGRQYAVGDAVTGSMTSNEDWAYTHHGGKFAGGTQNAETFAASRQEASTNAPGLSYFRNRVYDQATGRWTQEDPIGVAGGVNLYQFNGNNPVAFTDPFGLSPDCKDGETCYRIREGTFTDRLLKGTYEECSSGSDCSPLLMGVAPNVGGPGLARALGRAGEAAAGIVKNSRRIPSLTGTAKFRVPDGLTPTSLTEVKNVASQGFTSQLRDFASFAEQTGRSFTLMLRSPETMLSGPLQDAVRAGRVILDFLTK